MAKTSSNIVGDIDLLRELSNGQCDPAGIEYYVLLSSVRTQDLKQIPKLIVEIIERDAWKKWRWIGSEFSAPSIDAYLEAHPPKGIGIGVDLFRRLILDNRPALDRFDQARQRGVGRPPASEILDNVQDNKAPTGNSVEATIRRLRKDHEELYARWLTGELSANAAAIEAGFRKKFTPFEQTERLIAKHRPEFTDDQCAKLRRLLE
jgi:hypothetical protein